MLCDVDRIRHNVRRCLESVLKLSEVLQPIIGFDKIAEKKIKIQHTCNVPLRALNTNDRSLY